jgi:hypothetical protein
MFLRFAVHDRDEDSGREKGVFTALYGLADQHSLSDYEMSWFVEQEVWFTKHLKRPPDLKDHPLDSVSTVRISLGCPIDYGM